MRTEYKPNERMINRVAEIWKRALANPVYESGNPRHPHLPSMMADAMVRNLPRDNTTEKLNAFGVALAASLMDAGDRHTLGYYDQHLDVDYQPCGKLRKAAEAAGLKMHFPIKTRMYFCNEFITFSMGYASECEYHYPLKNGRWLVTRLSGEDIGKVVEYVDGGKPEFTVEVEA